VSASRLHQQGCLEPRDDEKPANGFHSTGDPVTTGPPDGTARDFAESQRAGLAAVISLAKVSASNGRLPPALASLALQLELSPPDLVSGAAPASAGPATAASAPEIDQPVVTERLDSVISDRSPAAGAPADEKRETVGIIHNAGYLRPLLVITILTIQAVLSIRLMWSNTAYIDEATYAWAGHLEVAHWLHGTPAPPFQTWFSGAPAIYPPISAVADGIGGLIGVRILSLVFMLGATALLWGITSRLFGSRAAFFAAALFAVLGPTQFLGALGTYDAMALLFVAISAWCAVAARDHGDSTALLVASAFALALANATKYATALFDPVVVVLAALAVAQKRGAKPALGRAGYLAAVVTALLAALLALGGPLYMAGVMYTTLARAIGHDSSALVLEDSWKWVGIVWILAWLGVIISLRRGSKAQTLMLALLAAAGLLAPLEQARIHTVTSLHKHVDFGAWLAAPAAGYALAQLSRISKRRSLSFTVAGLIAAAAILPAVAVGSAQARSLFQGWPDSSLVIAKLRNLIRSHPGSYLAEDYDIPGYYLENSVSWQRWSDTWYFAYTPPGARRPLTGAAAYQAAITRHYFSLVLLDFFATPGTDRQIVADMQRTGDYQIVAVVHSSFGPYTVWAYRPGQQQERGHGHR
jgi:Dolichyl-phosphate-mannose-protein mannosyltransferase